MAYRCTPELQEKVARFVRAGGFVWVAAEAVGLPREVLADWMRRGARRGRQPYRGFREAILQARAQARLKAEMETRNQFPRDWLRFGPGRERPGQPGWSYTVRRATAVARTSLDLLKATLLIRHLIDRADIPEDVRIRIADAAASVRDSLEQNGRKTARRNEAPWIVALHRQPSRPQ